MVATTPSVASNPAMLCRLAYRGTFGEGDVGDWQCLARRKMKGVGIVADAT
jgi:hypothetical protein